MLTATRAGVRSPETLNCTASSVHVKMFRVCPSHLRAESILVQPHHGRLPGAVINGHELKPASTFAHMTLRQQPLGRSNHEVLLFSGDAKFRERRQLVANAPRSTFHKCHSLAILT